MRRYEHDLSHYHLLTADMGQLIPATAQEVLPGDSFIHQASALVRVAPMAFPVMHPIQVRLHHWFVPNRILWTGWEDFITGVSSTPPPTLTAANTAQTVLLDHLGIEPVVGTPVDCLAVRAYNTIWNEFYRDQDLQTERNVDDLTLARCAWQKDYFTSARPSPQNGSPVSIGFTGGSAPVTGISRSPTGGAGVGAATGEFRANDAYFQVGGKNMVFNIDSNGVSSIAANLAGVTGAISVQDLRRALALQRFAEARMAFGDRYVDMLRYFGQRNLDARLQRPEYLGGSTDTISISEVLATAEGTNTDVGDMYGHGIAAMRTRRYRRYFEEHGWMISLLSVRPASMYMNGIPRRFWRRTNMDYWQPELETLPWQGISNREVYGSGDSTITWGWIPRYDEYRHAFSYVSGSFRTTEEDWHMGRKFTSQPTLNGSFVECLPTDRIYSDTSMPEVLVSVHHNLRARRLVSQQASIGEAVL